MIESNARGRFLRINLSNQEIGTEIVPDQLALDFVGGRGFGINYLYQELAPGVDPLGEHNKLLILTGVLAGTSAQSVSRWMVCTKSPLTGAFISNLSAATPLFRIASICSGNRSQRRSFSCAARVVELFGLAW